MCAEFVVTGPRPKTCTYTHTHVSSSRGSERAGEGRTAGPERSNVVVADATDDAVVAHAVLLLLQVVPSHHQPAPHSLINPYLSLSPQTQATLHSGDDDCSSSSSLARSTDLSTLDRQASKQMLLPPVCASNKTAHLEIKFEIPGAVKERRRR